MKKLLLLFVLIPYVISAQQMWRPLGDDDFNRASFGFSKSGAQQRMVAKNGYLYLFNMEEAEFYPFDKRVFSISKYNGVRWEQIESTIWTIGNYVIDATIGNDGTPYVFFNDPTAANQATVKKFNGTDWVNVGDGIVAASSSPFLSIVVGTDNLPRILYHESGVVKLKMFNGVSWDLLTQASDLLPVTEISLVLDNNNVPYAFSNYQVGSTYNSFVRKFNGTAWEEVGITGFSSRSKALAFDGLNTPYLFVGYAIKKFVDGNWSDLPNASGQTSSIIQNGYARFAFTNTNELVVGYQGFNVFQSSLHSYFVKKYVNNAWQPLATFPEFNNWNSVSFAIDNDQFYQMYTAQGYVVGAKKLVGNTYETLGGNGYYSAPSYPKLDFKICNGIPMVAYLGNYFKASVRMHVDGQWTQLGAPSFSENEVAMVRIKSGTDGQIYVAYNNEMSSTANDTKMTVKKLTMTGWETVGIPNFSLSAGDTFDFQLSHANEPHVLYMNGRVQKFNGATWVYVGGSAYSGAVASRLAFDANDVPYIAFIDPSNAGRIAVKKLNGNVWEYVDQPGLDAFQSARFPRLAVDSSNTLYLGFADSAKKIHIKKFNGITWQAVGEEYFTNTNWGTIMSPQTLEIAVDHNDVLHVLYDDNYNDFKLKVNLKKYNGNTWEFIGEPFFTAGSSYNAQIDFTANNTPMIAHAGGNYFPDIFVKYFGDENALATTDLPLQTNSKITIAPNPTANSFTVTSIETIETVNVFDLLGKCMIQNRHVETIDISTLQRGIYIVKVNTDGGTYSQKIVKK